MSTAKVIIVTGAIGTVVGIGYAIARKRGDDKPDDPPAEPTTAAPTGPDDPATGPSGPTPTPTPTTSPRPRSPDRAIVTPLPEPDNPRLYARINRSQTRRGVVREGPMQLLEQAARHDREVDLDELTGARLAASEHHSGSFTELACIVDAELNRADRRGKSLFDSLTHDYRFGKQGGKRPASTARDPRLRHLLAARAVLRGGARGISRGASRFFDPECQQHLNAIYRAWLDGDRTGKKPAVVSCDALTLLEAWSFDYGRRRKSRCPPDRTKLGSKPLAWVGSIPGVDPLRLMLMKPMPRGPEHTRMYERARAVLERGLAEES